MNNSIIGTGNLAFHYSEIFMSNIGINLIEIFGRKKTLPKEFNNSINYCNCLTKLNEADFYIICVSDDYIKKISKKILFGSPATIATKFFIQISLMFDFLYL